MVAKTYQGKPLIGEPFIENGKSYIFISSTAGKQKKVRWYTEKEYYKMYPEEKKKEISTSSFKLDKKALGFENGYIHIFKPVKLGENDLEWCLGSNLRYARWWGWYLISTEVMPEDLPSSFIPKKLSWNEVSSIDSEKSLETYIKNLF